MDPWAWLQGPGVPELVSNRAAHGGWWLGPLPDTVGHRAQGVLRVLLNCRWTGQIGRLQGCGCLMAAVCMLVGEVCPEAKACLLVGGPGLQTAGLLLSCSWCPPTGGWSWIPGSLAGGLWGIPGLVPMHRSVGLGLCFLWAWPCLGTAVGSGMSLICFFLVHFKYLFHKEYMNKLFC